jgi:signal transduction histidine kinase
MLPSERALHETKTLFAAAIVGASDLQTICEELTIHFRRLVEAERTIIYVVDHARRRIVLCLSGGQPAGDEKDLAYDELQQGISGLVFKSGRPILSQSPDDNLEAAATREYRRQHNIGALLVVPLTARGQVIGTMTGINRAPQRLFTQHDVDLLLALATQAGAAIDNARLLAEAKRQVERWKSISALSEIAGSQPDEAHLFELLYRQTLRLTQMDEAQAAFFLARYEPQPQNLVFTLCYERGVRRPEALPMEKGLASWVVRHNCPLLTEDLIADQAKYGFHALLTERERATGRPARACLALPLRRGNSVTGVLSVQSLQPGVLNEDHLALLTLWAGPIAIALDNARRVETLRGQAAELQTRNAELEAFAHTVAHNIKNPLQIVLGYARSSLKRFDQLDGPAMRDNLYAIAHAGQKLNNIVDELMLLAGLRETLGVSAQPLDMAEIVIEACGRLAELMESYAADIVMPVTWPSAVGYGPWVEEVWTNYISNAIKYGGQPPRVELGATADGENQVRFWVRDNGPGLAPEEQARLFMPFERLNQAQIQGHGLGLSIVRRIVEKLGGQASVESAPGEGCTFSFTLPAKAAGPAGAQAVEKIL